MALIEGVKYGLSSYPSSSAPNNATATNNKTVLFVKLTDSAIRAIEEYLRTQQKTGQNATLQFLGNDGRINIPSSHSSQGQVFDFSLQSNADIEGPQGSFECIQQSSSRSLDSMGALPFKIRVKANDNVYEETRQRFIQAEDIRKQECAKVIKQNGPDIGRKVKKKMDQIPPPLNRRETSPFSHAKFSPNNSSSTNTKTTNASSLGHSSSNSSINRTFNGFNSVGNNNSGINTRPAGSCKPGIGPADIAKRPLKERLIHLLSIKPFKKPELQSRLSRDGIKDREKQLVMTILKQISIFKNNEYVLLRGVWNDVQEDWPCYTEQERQLMKRRKPQNLTPPGSDSSVSSGVSGCSPRSTASTSSGGHLSPSHNQSSQYSNSHFETKSGVGINKYSSGGGQQNGHRPGDKRPMSSDPMIVGPDGILLEDISGYEDVPNSKKPRVSHFKRPVRNPGSTSFSSSDAGLSVGRSDRDGLSPHLHQNRVAERLSPISCINGSSNNSGPNAGLALSFGGHGNSVNADGQLSPQYYSTEDNNNHTSPRDEFHTGDDNMGGFSPYTWTSKVGDPQGTQAAMDSDETDSIDSGNGSSTSTSGRHYHNNEETGFATGAAFQDGASLSSTKPNNQSQGTFSMSISNCNRVSSTTNGSGEYLSPHSSPESHGIDSLPLNQPQKGDCDMRPGNDQVSVATGGYGESESATGHGSSPSTSKHGAKEEYCDHRRSDKERGSGRDREREFRSRDKDKSDRKDRENRKSAQSKGPELLPPRKAGDHTNNSAKDCMDCPYLTQYTAIESDEQRSRYKDDFNSDYPRYRDLHDVIGKVSKKFAQLEERLREEVRGSVEYQNIRDQIVKEYYASKKDRKYQEAKEKFNYLHKKLSHIKELVSDYDRHLFGHECSPVR